MISALKKELTQALCKATGLYYAPTMCWILCVVRMGHTNRMVIQTVCLLFKGKRNQLQLKCAIVSGLLGKLGCVLEYSYNVYKEFLIYIRKFSRYRKSKSKLKKCI